MDGQRRKLAPPVLLRQAVVGTCLWLFAFSSGMLIDSSRFRQSLIFSDDILANVIFLPLAIFTFTPTNVAILSILSGFLGGILGNLRAPDVARELQGHEVLLDSLEKTIKERRQEFLQTPTEQLQSLIDLKEDKKREQEALVFALRRHLGFLDDPALISAIRGLIVYLVYLATVLLATNTDFNFQGDGASLGPTTLAEIGPLAIDYIRFAALVSILTFALGYDPSSFEALVSRATRFLDSSKSS